MKTARGCIFCGGRPLTKEHFWPIWLREVLPLKWSKRQHRVLYHDLRGPSADPEEHTRPPENGDPGNWRPRSVCKACNTGWMSDLQNQARPILTPLVMGEWPDLDAATVETLTRWTCMTVMVVDTLDPRSQAISADERRAFAERSVYPASWAVWVGHAMENGQRRWFHHRGAALAGQMVEGPVACNTQATTLIAGHALLQAFSTRYADPLNHPLVHAYNADVRLAWPRVDSRVRMPPTFAPSSSRPEMTPTLWNHMIGDASQFP